VPFEEMGKVSKRLRFVFALSSMLFLGVLAVSPIKDALREWRRYKRDYLRFAQQRPDTKRLLTDYHSSIDQIWIPQMGVVDRCVTCHEGITQSSLLDVSVPQPFRAHTEVLHRVNEWGCVVCHRGQGLATEVKEAHETTLAWEQPLLPIRYIQASCGTCHRGETSETPQLNRGRELLAKLNCLGCHRLEGISRPVMLGPDLTNVGTKVSREWLYKWLKEPRTITDNSGNVLVSGVENEEEPRMPQFRLDEKELFALSGYLSMLKDRPVQPAKFDPRIVATWGNRPETVDQGEVRFREMFCTTCHSVAVTRAGETKLIGGEIGPELTRVGSKVNLDWLVGWLRDPEAYLPHALMPRYEWSDEDLYKLTRYITARLTDPDLLSNVPKLGQPTADELKLGRRLFTEKGCGGCHVVKGMSPQTDFGPDLSSLGGKTISQLEFGQSRIPRTLIAYVQAKITDPISVNSAARMPQYHLAPGSLEALTTALLSMIGGPKTPGMAKLVVSTTPPQFRPAGEFGEIYERYKCYVCHRFNGYGGRLAPDLSFEGSRAQRGWLIKFLKNPETLRPNLTFRMPQFNMTDREASLLADYLDIVFDSSSVKSAEWDSFNFTSQEVALGKQLYEVRYQCQSCHTIGSSGGYVGPNLSNLGNWMKPGWIAAWLRDPQQLVPGTIEPRRTFTDPEINALTAYLVSLKHGSASESSPSGTSVGRRK
jgi:mono/diheme cytochrome c family protein